MKSLASIIASPLLCLGILGTVVAENRTHLRAEDAEPYHARAAAALEAWPYAVGDWTSQDQKDIPKAALEMLRPNAILCRRYTQVGTDGSAAGGHAASLLIVQCRDSRDMAGHWPPNCYPAAGDQLIQQFDRTWKVGNLQVRGVEYHFEKSVRFDTERKCVYDFFIVPGKGTVPDMAGVQAAAADYQHRYFGAAQFQLLMDSDLPRERRDEIFTTLLGQSGFEKVFDVLNNVDVPIR